MSFQLSILIPFYNEEQSIPNFLIELRSVTELLTQSHEVIFIDNGSLDDSKNLIAEYIFEQDKNKSIHILLSETRRGKGWAIRKGIGSCRGQFIVIVDADNEYQIADLFNLLECRTQSDADLVLGTRKDKWAMRRIPGETIMSFYYNCGHQFFTWLFNMLFGTKLTDPATMWKLMRGDILRSLKLTGTSFNLDFELVAGFSKLNLVIVEVPVNYSARGKIQGKKIRPVIDPIIWLVSFTRYALRNRSRVLRNSKSEQKEEREK